MSSQQISQNCAGTARKLWALSATALGWSPDTFWNATPAELIGAFSLADGDQPDGITRADIARLLEGTENG